MIIQLCFYFRKPCMSVCMCVCVLVLNKWGFEIKHVKPSESNWFIFKTQSRESRNSFGNQQQEYNTAFKPVCFVYFSLYLILILSFVSVFLDGECLCCAIRNKNLLYNLYLHLQHKESGMKKIQCKGTYKVQL